MQKNALIVVLFSLIFISGLCAQDNYDTSKIIIKRVVKSYPSEYNISEIHLKKDKENLSIYVVRVDLDVPLKTKLKLTVKDTAGVVLMYLINDQIVPEGTYRIRWEMQYCNIPDCEGFKAGRYNCELETDQFIYVKDFFLK